MCSRVMNGSPFFPQCHVPEEHRIREFVCRPPPANTRLYCTMIRREDEDVSDADSAVIDPNAAASSGSGVAFVLYLEFLGGLIPLLKVYLQLFRARNTPREPGSLSFRIVGIAFEVSVVCALILASAGMASRGIVRVALSFKVACFLPSCAVKEIDVARKVPGATVCSRPFLSY